MKAVVCQAHELNVVERPDPVPGEGQLLLEVLRCGICGSDLHARDHAGHWGSMMARAGHRHFMQAGDPVVFGHEFCGEVADYGPGCRRRMRPGTRVVALPALRLGTDTHLVGFSSRAGGGYAERMLVQEQLTFPVPDGLPTQHAALTEPMAIAWHGIRRSEIRTTDVAIVIGCGPVGLATICLLKAMGVGIVVASNSSPARRELATRCGADIVVDPRAESPFSRTDEFGHVEGLDDAFGLVAGALDRFERLPVPWWHSWRIAEKLGAAAARRPVVFECVGLPGVIQSLIDGAPMFSRIVVVGVCMETDRFEPALAVNKEIDLRFALGYTPLEFRDTLHRLADGRVDCAALVTGEVGLEGVEAAFDALGRVRTHAKILIDPKSPAREPVPGSG